MIDRYAELKARALAAITGDKATEMCSRCMSCGKDLNAKAMKAGSTECLEHGNELMTPPPHAVQRPGGGATTPRPPMTKDSNGAAAALGGPGSGPHPGAGKSTVAKVGSKLKAILRGVKDASKEIGHGIVNQYHIPDRDSKGNRPEDRDTRGPINDTAKGRDPWD